MPREKRNRSELVGPVATPSSGYRALLTDVKARIRVAQIKASLSVNRELIQLYWDIGVVIVSRQRSQGWGKSIVERLAADLQKEFPGMAGFSPQNIWYMRAFCLAWTDEVENLQRAVGESDREILQRAVGESSPSAPPAAVAQIPWGQNIELITKLKNPLQRLWYAQQTTANGWSRNMLVHWIESDLYSRQGKAVTNFKSALPQAQSDLANEIVRDPYNFEFLTLSDQAAERELEDGLLAHIRKFLIELGAGFAFVGQQVHLPVDGEDFYIDLLFYHLKLRCYIVVEIKTTPFKPEYVGKMNFYLSAVDDLLRHPEDKLSIGLILCRTRSRVIAEYALRNVSTPVGVTRYTTKLMESLPAELKDSLPSPKSIEAELESQDRKLSSVETEHDADLKADCALRKARRGHSQRKTAHGQRGT
jgi:predicted nuclease of restriction endonuclease-like (RecB) superfamily